MTARTVRINLGDWGDDGHGKTKTVIVELSGGDVSDAALCASYRAAVEATGVNLLSELRDYEDSYIDMEPIQEVWDAARPARLAAHEGAKDCGWGLCEPFDDTWYARQPDDYDLNCVDLLMAYIGYTVKDFSYRVVEFPVLVGGSGTILTEHEGDGCSFFGYGCS